MSRNQKTGTPLNKVTGPLFIVCESDLECSTVDIDKQTISPPLHVRALMTDRPDLPLILGLHGLLDQSELVCRIGRGEAWINL